MDNLPDLFQALSGMTLLCAFIGAVIGLVYPLWGKEDPIEALHESWQFSPIGALVGGGLWQAIVILS